MEHQNRKTMNKVKEQLEGLADKYGIQIIYAFGSRAREALEMVEGKRKSLSPGPSDLDIGVKPERKLTVEEKVEIALALEDIFDVHRVDLVVVPEVEIYLAFKAVTGELLYARDPVYEAEYQLYIMGKAADLLPYEKERQRIILGF